MHRIGRTARAGADGVAISFCDGEERAYLRDIEKLIRMSIPATDRRSDQRARGRAAPEWTTHARNRRRASTRAAITRTTAASSTPASTRDAGQKDRHTARNGNDGRKPQNRNNGQPSQRTRPAVPAAARRAAGRRA